MAFFGGTLKIDKEYFEILLFMVLSIAGILLLVNNKSFDDRNCNKKNQFFFSIIIGSILGFVSGVVGIGGGIFLSPILFLFKADSPKNYCH